jgi:hypothetical protein
MVQSGVKKMQARELVVVNSEVGLGFPDRHVATGLHFRQVTLTPSNSADIIIFGTSEFGPLACNIQSRGLRSTRSAGLSE